jgi:hypothetical protein
MAQIILVSESFPFEFKIFNFTVSATLERDGDETDKRLTFSK